MARDIRNADQLRHRIDSGETGEKVDFPDPAAAPLGTDAEAGGNPPTRSELAMEGAASDPRRRFPAWRRGDAGLAIYLGMAVPGAILVLLIIALTRAPGL